MPVDDDDVLNGICELAHRLWRQSMEDDGWKRGAVYDAEDRTHPHLCSYMELAPPQRRYIREWIEHERVDDQLRQAVDFALRWDEWSAEELRAGMRVRFCNEKDPTADALGRILDWQAPAPEGGGIESFRVQWDDGSVVEYPANARYIVRAEEP